MGHLASKMKGDSPPLPSNCHPWSQAPCGSWVIRFSPSGPVTQKHDKVAGIKGLALYHWLSPDWVTADAFNTLMFVIVQIFLEGNYNRLARLMEEPLEAAEMIAQFNTFITSTNQDMKELQNQLFEAAHESICLYVEDDQLRHLDLLITNAFDPQYELRAVLSRKSRSSKSSLLHSVTSKVKSKLARLKNKGLQRSRRTPAQPSFPASSHTSTPPLRPTAPWLSEFIERTETVTTNDGVDSTNEIPIIVVSDNSKENGTKDGDRESFEVENRNDQSTRKSEEKRVDFESNMSSSNLSLHSTSDIVLPLSEVVTSEQSPDEVIAKQRSVCCTEVNPEASSDTCSSFLGGTENKLSPLPKEGSKNDKNAGYGSCVQEDARKDSGIHVWHAEVEEPDSSNGGQLNNDVPSSTISTSGAMHDDSSEHNNNNNPPCIDAPTGFKQAELDGHSKDNCEQSKDISPLTNVGNGLSPSSVPSDLKYAEPSKHDKDGDPTCSDVPSSLEQADSHKNSHNNGPVNSEHPQGTNHEESNLEDISNDPAHEDVSPVSPTSQHHNSNEPMNVMAPKEKQLGKQCKFLPIYGLSKHCLRSTTRQVSTAAQELLSSTNAEKEGNSDEPLMHQPSSSSFACLPFHGLSRGSFSPPQQGALTGVRTRKRKADNEADKLKLAEKRVEGEDINPCHSTAENADTQSDTKKPKQVSTDAQGICGNVKEGSGTESKQVHKPSSSSFGCLPFHGLSRGSFSPPRQGASTGVQTRKRQADIDEANCIEPVVKRLKTDNICETGGQGYPCHSRSEGDDSLPTNDKELNPRCDTADDAESIGDDSSGSESIEWHDALEDIES